MASTKQEMRQQLLAARHSIAAPQRKSAAMQLCQSVTQLPYYSTAQNIALYWPMEDEIDCLPLLNLALKQQKKCFLPILLLDLQQKLAFASYTPTTPLVKNRYGISEPELTFASVTRLLDLDLIFVPLVGFDKQGHRLGRGGGYYDATFADLNKHPHSKWPKLVGLAYDCQCIDEIPIDGWDWQLDAVVTETKIYTFK